MPKPNFIFFGTPDVASKTLDILKASGYTPTLIVTSPDKPQGRKMLMTPSPVKVWAIENNIPFIQPEKTQELENIIFRRGLASDGETTSLGRPGTGKAELFKLQKVRTEEELIFSNEDEYDFSLVVAYGKILPESLIKSPRLGSINIHYSLLPKYRGASPVESAILAGDTVTGVSIQQMEYKMDSGPILAEERVEILPTETTEDLRSRLIKIGGGLLVKMLPEFLEGKITSKTQDETEATFCKKIKKEDGHVDLEAELPSILYNKLRAYNKWPRIFFFQNSKRIIITDAVLENGKFVIKKVLPEGKKEVKYEDFLKQS